MDEANLCDRIALIQKGKILSIDTPAKIVQSYPEKLFAIKSSNAFKLLQDVRDYSGTETCFAFGDALHTTFKSGEESVVNYLKSKGHNDVSIETITPGIEDCFIELLKIKMEK